MNLIRERNHIVKHLLEIGIRDNGLVTIKRTNPNNSRRFKIKVILTYGRLSKNNSCSKV